MNIIIMAGGSGTRFWPASREDRPKQFLNIIGSRPLIEQTFLRVAPLAEERNIHLVINALHRDLTEKIFEQRQVKILAEPVGCNTAPCIGLAAIHLRWEAGDVPMVVLPADHFIADEEAFRSTLRAAAKLAQAGGIVTIGIPPTRPETGYGYILKGSEQETVLSQPVFLVERFVEKPDLRTATEYMVSGQYLWNSGIFVFTPNTILQEIHQHLPKIDEGLVTLERQLNQPGYQATLEEIYAGWPNISIDYGVMEKTSRPVHVVPGSFGWSDVGSWEALYELRRKERDEQDNLVDGSALLVGTKDSFIYSRTERLIATLGLSEILIVDTPDAVLVADLRRSQEVRRFTEELRRRGLKRFL
ncbi:MAG: mannose-1-phosphate guanylyltransferase [Acidobacteria bacterium]|nr:mannose-1-phosphate guanylyltransferase [Acidobacteriota bacterium]